MTDKTSRLKKTYPKVRVDRLDRLVAALEDMVWLPHAMAGDNLPVYEDVDDARGEKPYFDMSSWHEPVSAQTGVWTEYCGTAACIGGMVSALRMGRRKSATPGSHHQCFDVGVAEYLGISNDAAHEIILMYPYRDPKHVFLDREMELNDAVNTIHGGMAATRPRHAVAMLRHFRETGVVDWPRAVGLRRDLTALTQREIRLRKAEDRAAGLETPAHG